MALFSPPTKESLLLKAVGLLKIPMLGFTGPKIVRSTDERFEVRIPLSWRTKNHLGCMYFGALAVGADTVVGFLAMRHIQQSKHRIDLIFKDFHADYKKRAESHVHFVCDQGAEIAALVKQAEASGERVTKKFHAKAYCPSIDPHAVVAEFTLSLSLKRK